MTTATRHKDPRTLKLAALFAEAAKRGIEQNQLRNEIAPRELGKRLSEASEAEIAALARYIRGDAPPPSQIVGTKDEGRGTRDEGHDRPLISGYKERFEELRGREGFASPQQLRRIEACWMDISRMPNRAAKEKALQGFLKRIVGVEDLRFLESWMVHKVLAALQKMAEKKA